MIDLSNIDYVFTVTGGFINEHKLYAVTKDKKILFTDSVDVLDSVEAVSNESLEYLFDLQEDLDFIEHDTQVIPCTSICTMYQVTDGELNQLYRVGMYKNTPAVDRVLDLHFRNNCLLGGV